MSRNGPNPDHPVSRPPITDLTLLVMLAFRGRYGWREIPTALLHRAPRLLRRGWSIEETLDWLVEWGGMEGLPQADLTTYARR